MSPRHCLARVAALAAFVLAAPAWSQSRIVPSDPVQFERISLRQVVDSCAFDPDVVQVSAESGVLLVVQRPRQCLVPGPPATVDIQLGAFPPGDYRVEIRHAVDQPTLERLSFTVQGLVRPAVFPPPPFPLANYGGIWWQPAESGWGLSLHHSRVHALFGALYVFGADRVPRWYTMGSGQWESSTRWRGQMFGSQGPFWAAAGWDAGSVAHRVVGSVAFDFSLVPERPDTARMDYTIDGVTVSKTISRIRY